MSRWVAGLCAMNKTGGLVLYNSGLQELSFCGFRPWSVSKGAIAVVEYPGG